MEYAPYDLSPRERYKVLTGFVLPRPIAWVTTVGPKGVVNAAPFSFFNVFCEDPPLCMFAVNLRPDGRLKDTLANIQRTGEFVVNLADEPLARTYRLAVAGPARGSSSGTISLPSARRPECTPFHGRSARPSSLASRPGLA